MEQLALGPDRIDGQGGATLNGLSGSAVRVTAPGLRILCLEDCPSLGRLDLTGCPDLTWIAVQRLPRLAHLSLAGAGPGADIHIDFGQALPGLLVEGAISDIDFCWSGGAVSTPGWRDRQAPLAGAYIGNRMSLAADVCGFVALLGGVSSPAPGTAASDREVFRHFQCRELVLPDGGDLEAIRLPETVSAACVQQFPHLRSLDAGSTGHLRIEGCPELRVVDGCGQALTVVDSASTWPLVVQGAWDHLTVREAAVFGLEAPFIKDLNAPLVARGDAAEAAVAALVRATLAGDGAARTVLLRWCEGARSPRARLAALQALADLAENGWDADRLWSIRMRLISVRPGRGQRPPSDEDMLPDIDLDFDDDVPIGKRHRHHPGHEWSWRLPEDLANRGWEADLRLWLACRPHLKLGTADLGTPWSPRHLATATAVLRSCRDPVREAALLEVISEAARCARFFRVSGSRACDRSFDGADGQLLKQVILNLGGLRGRGAARVALGSFLSWLRRNLGGPARVQLLGALHLAGYEAARADLIALSQDHKLDPEQRTRSLMLALAPPRTRTFCLEPTHE